jgi:hypothetical protein
MYHGYVPDLHIHAEDTLLPFYLGERDNAEYAINRPAGQVWTLSPAAWRCTVSKRI